MQRPSRQLMQIWAGPLQQQRGGGGTVADASLSYHTGSDQPASFSLYFRSFTRRITWIWTWTCFILVDLFDWGNSCHKNTTERGICPPPMGTHLQQSRWRWSHLQCGLHALFFTVILALMLLFNCPSPGPKSGRGPCSRDAQQLIWC